MRDAGSLARLRFDMPFRGEAVGPDLLERFGRAPMRESSSLKEERHGSCKEQETQEEDEYHGSALRP